MVSSCCMTVPALLCPTHYRSKWRPCDTKCCSYLHSVWTYGQAIFMLGTAKEATTHPWMGFHHVCLTEMFTGIFHRQMKAKGLKLHTTSRSPVYSTLQPPLCLMKHPGILTNDVPLIKTLLASEHLTKHMHTHSFWHMVAWKNCVLGQYSPNTNRYWIHSKSFL